MNADEDRLHVIPLDGHWEVEDQGGLPLAQEDNKEDAIRDAQCIAEKGHIPRIVLHDGDGVTEEIPLEHHEDRLPSIVPPAEEA